MGGSSENFLGRVCGVLGNISLISGLEGPLFLNQVFGATFMNIYEAKLYSARETRGETVHDLGGDRGGHDLLRQLWWGQGGPRFVKASFGGLRSYVFARSVLHVQPGRPTTLNG